MHERRWGPWIIDLDIVNVEGVVSINSRLTLPHPRAGERPPVLEPWTQIEPETTLDSIPIVSLIEKLWC